MAEQNRPVCVRLREESCRDRVATRRAQVDQRLSDGYKYRLVVTVVIVVVVIVVIVVVTVSRARPDDKGGCGTRDGGRRDGRADGGGHHAVRQVIVGLGGRRGGATGASAGTQLAEGHHAIVVRVGRWRRGLEHDVTVKGTHVFGLHRSADSFGWQDRRGGKAVAVRLTEDKTVDQYLKSAKQRFAIESKRDRVAVEWRARGGGEEEGIALRYKFSRESPPRAHGRCRFQSELRGSRRRTVTRMKMDLKILNLIGITGNATRKSVTDCVIWQ